MPAVETTIGPPWPVGPAILLLDEVSDLTIADLDELEARTSICVAVVSGACTGPALAAACAAHLLVAGPDATFGRPGSWADAVLRRGTGIMGRRAAGYLALSGRSVAAMTARSWGLVNTVAEDPLSEAQLLARGVASRSETAVRTILRQCTRGSHHDYAYARLTGAAH
jgi:enoyl-CoA hydratase/carnithine racemase